MGRIKKAAGPKHEATVSPAIAEFVTTASTITVSRLPEHLKSFPRRWPFPKGDLYHWIPLFNRFDTILDRFIVEYGLHDGPQVRPLGRAVLLQGVAEESKAATITPTSQSDLDSIGFGMDGDRQMVESILEFSRRLLESCGNRSLYSSSERLGHLLNTTSLSLLTTTLQLAVRLAQRYQASRQRGHNAYQHLNNALLASHYNIDLEKVQKLANPFLKSPSSVQASTTTPAPSLKGKEKSHNFPSGQSSSVNPNDLLTFTTRDTKTSVNGSAMHISNADRKGDHASHWDDWGSVLLSYYQPATALKEDPRQPPTPTPARRPSGLSRQSRLSSSDDSPDLSMAAANLKHDLSGAGGMRHIEIPYSVIASSPVEEVLKDHLDNLPRDSRYELLTRVRSAHAITTSLATRQELVGIRLLALTNLAYIYLDTIFQQKILQQDSDEPRRLQLVYQLADLVHPPGDGASAVPYKLQTLALAALEALIKQKAKAPDVIAALNIHVSHGVLFYVLRRAVAEMAIEESDDESSNIDKEERQEALFSLLETLPAATTRTIESLIASGLLDILVEVLNLRTRTAERSHPKVLTFLNTFICPSRDAMQSLANSKGLEAISDLLDYEVRSSMERAKNGEGLPEGFCTRVIDYQIPYFQQQSLKMVFKLIAHMMTNGTGNLDRLLRNLIDSPQLLSGLKTVITNPKIFGSSVWASAINIMSTFIHNEPTSYAVISEAGLNKGLLESIGLDSAPEDPMKVYLDFVGETDVFGPGLATSNASSIAKFMRDDHSTTRRRAGFAVSLPGILPSSEAVLAVPQAFGAICLNHSGMQMFLESGALNSFFKLFESNDHIKSMAADRGDLPRFLGNSFDELVRHHPTLKMSVVIAIMTMVERLGDYCQASATERGCGAKLWLQGEDGSLVPAGEDGITGTRRAKQSPIENDDHDMVMDEASPMVETIKSSAMESEAPLVTTDSIEREEKSSRHTATRIAVVMNFLSGFFENTSLCSFFIEAGGANYVLNLATMPSLQYDFNIQDASHHLARVVHIMVEQKPHLVLPSLLQRTQNAAETLGPLCSHTSEEGFFSEFTSSERHLPEGYIPVSHASIGTTIVKSLVNVQTLCNILFEVFSSPIFTPRSGHTPFSQVNLGDMYRKLIKSLGLLHKVCVWEEILLQKKLPEAWKEATKLKGMGIGSDEADELFGFLDLDGELSGLSDSPTANWNSRATASSINNGGSTSLGKAASISTTKDEKTAQFKNAKALHYLLSQVPSTIILFSQNLGKALTPKRRPEAYARQNAYLVAEAISEASLGQLTYNPPRIAASIKDRYAYWIVALRSVSSLMIDRTSTQVLTLLLQVFKNAGGLDAIKEIVNILFEEVNVLACKDLDKLDAEEKARLFSANAGIRMILPFYSQITIAKSIVESSQTNTISSSDRDRGSPYYFSAPQFLVELRMAILPVIKSIWNSEVVEKAESSIIRGLIGILRSILEGGEEGGAFRRTDETTAPKNVSPKIYTIQSDRVRELQDEGHDEEIAREALYRCMNERHLAREYCQALKTFAGASRCPIPSYDREKPRDSASQSPRREDSGATLPALNQVHQAGGSNNNVNPLSSTADDRTNTSLAARTTNASRTLDAAGGVEPLMSTEPLLGVEGADAQGSSSASRRPPPPAPGVPAETEVEAAEGMEMSIDNLQTSNSHSVAAPRDHDAVRWTMLADQLSGSLTSFDPTPNRSGTPQPANHITIDDLDEERSSVRQNLIDRALDVVNAHEHVTFELADLINAATAKSPDAKTMRREIGATLVQSLISLQMEDDFRPTGKKIASYANLLALVIQDHKLYEATWDELVANLDQFLGFIKIFADQPPDEGSPWIGQILLVIEKMLAEDVQPSIIQWNISTDGRITEGPIVDIAPSYIPTDAKVKLFEAIVEILPRVGKDESLALSVVRALVILTRSRDLASRLSEKRNIQRLFVMVKQLAGLTTDRLLGTFMVLLRHLVEDEETIRQIMRSEIMTRFETRRGGQTDTANYVKQMYDLVLRSPQIFVDVTNEKLEIPRYEPSQRVNQNLQLKPEVKDDSKEHNPTDGNIATSTTEASTGAVDDERAEAPKPSTVEQDEPSVQKAKANETKAPVIEHPSGVIHFLLLELLNYKDVEDKDPTISAKDLLKDMRTIAPDTQNSGDATNGTSASISTTASPAMPDALETKKSEKPELKPEQHPIHYYRLFLLQCLAELLHCYNSTKVEFINFSRKADAKAMTPSKPRSGVLNYLLNDVIPEGTLSHEETLAYKKKNLSSTWAKSVIVSLCLRTNEKGYHKKQGSLEEDEESDLLFVRKFVLEHALKAYKDANASEEEADVKYARLLDLADLFNRLLQGQIVPPVGTPPAGMENIQKSIAKLMFEKNFISALTSSIADIDLNFPASKRAIKYILKPLKQLTSTAVVLSQDSDISTTPSHTDDDEISTATSVSDIDDEREETPDLFRNSTLGMFEPGREDESSSDSSAEDEEMYDEEYDDGMDYEEGLDRDEDEVVSDEDEELGEAGHMEGLPGDTAMDVEVVIDGDEEDPSEDEDEDDQDDSEDDMDNMDDDDVIEVIDEINGDSENGSLAGGEDDGWQDEDGDDMERYNEEAGYENDLSQDPDAERAVRDIVREFGGAEAALQRLEGLEDGPSDLQMDIDSGRYMEDVVHLDDDDDEEDDEDGGEEDADDDDVIYQPEYDDEEPGMPDHPFGWDPDDEMSLPRHHHHHHHHHPRRIPDVTYPTLFGGGVVDRTPLYRSHRPASGPRSNDDNVNPLLQRHDRSMDSRSPRGLRSEPSDVAAGLNDYWVHRMESARRPRGIMPGESPLSFLNSLIASVDQNGGFGLSAMGGPNGALHLHIAGGPGGGLSLPRELQIALRGTQHTHQDPQHIGRDEHRQSAAFQPAATYQRWQEEARLLYGNLYAQKAEQILNTILRLLVPPALEKKKREEEDSKRKQEAEKLRKEEQEAREKAEKEAQEKLELEEREAAAVRAAEEAEAAARAQEESREELQEAEDTEDIEDGGAMEGVESTEVTGTSAPAGDGETGEVQAPGEPSAAAGPSEPTERVRTTIRGRELDITGLGIDLAYLDALPEDIREEVLMSQLAIQRSQAQAAGEEPTDISREFLEALPVEIREELLQQEAQDRRRREREEARRRQQAVGGAPARGAEDMDPASFLASLDPTLRQHVLMDQDEEILAHLPEEIAAEARALGGDRAMQRFAGIPRGGRGSGLVRHLLDGSRQPPAALEKPPRRQTVQMLDKAGVATLLRLMFIPQQGSSRTSLNGILHDVSKNRQNRAEVISLLLSILQDGSADVNAVERSFAHLSLRAKQPATQKTPQTLKRTFAGQITSVANNMEATPLMVIQQCLNALVSLTHYNLSIPWFFLTEHEASTGIKTKANRKGKGKETRASKYALNALLSLLDRKLIMESSGCMEQLSSLLQSVTHPLLNLLRKEKENTEEKPKESDLAEIATASPTVMTTHERNADEQPTEGAIESVEPSIEESTPPVVQVEAITATGQQELPATTNEVEAKDEQDEKKPADANKAVGEEKKKARTFTPPVVPEEKLRLVVNVLAARECSAKTFRDTLSTINNLSGIPGAKEVFGKGLIEQAQDLGQSILRDLDELVPQIKQAESGTDIQGMALAKFSPASSDQAKLLRVLTALDYLFDPKRNGGKTKPAAEEGHPGESSKPKEDILTTLYENATFGSLWNKLSECLSSIYQAEGMLNIATILLPLVEALMVVCKNTTLKDVPLTKTAKEFAITSPAPESYMENLFFKFTEDHRKILNELVRHNPKLMSANFALLVKNPKVLEFDNKRNYFTRRLHSRGTEARHTQPPLQLSVRRDEVFLDSFKFLHFKTGNEIKYGKLSIRFHGEEGVDAGGVTREWFQVLSRQMFNPDYALFIPVASDRTTFHPNKLSKVNDEHLMFFKFIGRIIGKALYEGRALDCHFSRAVYKRILGKTVSIKDMETLDLEYYKSLLWMLENDITDIITETFSVETDDFGVTQIVDLKENGRNLAVAEENKHEYVQLVVEYRLTGSVQEQLSQFLKGFHDIVPPELIAIFNEQELELLISGLPDIDVDDWKNHTEYHNYQISSAQIQWFWRAVRSFDKEERAKLLQFVTGTSKVPLNGFGQLEGMNGFSRFNIHRDYGNKDRLPSSHTCFNQLDLPEYDSYETLRQQVYTAMTAGSEYFGFA